MGEFKNVFKKLRTSQGYTQEELAKKLGITRSRLSMYESGAREPDFIMLETIADFFNVDTDYLIGRTSKTTLLPESLQVDSSSRSLIESYKSNSDLRSLVDSAAQLNPGDMKLASGLISRLHSAPVSDPLQSYLTKLSEFLTGSPEHRQLVSDAAHVRTEDIGLACQFLERLADPDSAAPDLPVLDTCNRQKDTNSDTLDTNSDTLDTSGDTSRDSDHVELTADTLALVRDTPEVLEAEAEYIKKMSVKPPKRGGTVSPSTEGTNRKSG